MVLGTNAYPGETLAARQREVYPDIQPLTLAISKDEAFGKALGSRAADGLEALGR